MRKICFKFALEIKLIYLRKPVYESLKLNNIKIRRMKKFMPRRKNNKTKFCVDSNCILWQV
jgi:hypothetical protein